MFWADKAGVREAKPFALTTSAPNGHASRKLKTVLGHHVSCPDLYAADLPGHSKHDVERSAQSTHFLPLHEQITNTWDAEAGCLTKLLELKAAGDLPASYTRHKVVLDHPSEPVVPLAIFLDGVPYSHTDSVLGCWGLNVLTGTRFSLPLGRRPQTAPLQVRVQRMVHLLHDVPNTALVSACLG